MGPFDDMDRIDLHVPEPVNDPPQAGLARLRSGFSVQHLRVQDDPARGGFGEGDGIHEIYLYRKMEYFTSVADK